MFQIWQLKDSVKWEDVVQHGGLQYTRQKEDAGCVAEWPWLSDKTQFDRFKMLESNLTDGVQDAPSGTH